MTATTSRRVTLTLDVTVTIIAALQTERERLLDNLEQDDDPEDGYWQSRIDAVDEAAKVVS
jgi:hypothetical protein